MPAGCRVTRLQLLAWLSGLSWALGHVPREGQWGCWREAEVPARLWLHNPVAQTGAGLGSLGEDSKAGLVAGSGTLPGSGPSPREP